MTTRLLLLFGVLLAAACGGGEDETVTVTISPTSATLAGGGTTLLGGTQRIETHHSVDVDSNYAIFDWRVDEGAGGGSLAPSPTSSAYCIYTAPAAPGLFHVTITSMRDPSASATATIGVAVP